MSKNSMVVRSAERIRIVAVCGLLGLMGCSADEVEAGDEGDETETETETGTMMEDMGQGLVDCASETDDRGIWAMSLVEETACVWRCPPNYAYQSVEPQSATPPGPDLSERDTIRVLVLGDIGNVSMSEDYPLITNIAVAAHEACQDDGNSGCDLGLLLGDNFYSHDVRDDTAQDWEAWRSVFERFCSTVGLCDSPEQSFRFWAAVGNHDYLFTVPGESPMGNLVQAQVDYTESAFNTGMLWQMPGRHYAIPNLPSWLHISVMDSVAQVEAPKWMFEMSGGEIALEQLDAIAEDLAEEPDERWNLVAGHHPGLTVGSRGTAYAKAEMYRCQSLVEVDQMRMAAKTMATSGMHVLLSGHEHNQQLNPGDGYLQLISGSSSKYSSSDIQDNVDHDTALFTHENSGGFAILTITQDDLAIQFYGDVGRVDGEAEWAELGDPFVYTRDMVRDLEQLLDPVPGP